MQTLSHNEIEEGNKKIAALMNWQHHEDKAYDEYEMANLKYHSNYESLMVVVEYIESLGFKTEIKEGHVIIYNPKNTIEYFDARQDSKRQAIWYAVSDFATWYLDRTNTNQ